MATLTTASRKRCTALLLLAALTMPRAAASAEEARNSPLTDDDKADFAWFDELGYPDMAKLRLVRVATGSWSEDDEGRRETFYQHALLVADEGENFTVLKFDLSPSTYTKSFDVEPHERVGYEAANLAEYAKKQLAALQAPPAAEPDRWHRFGESMSETGELFTLARVCAAQGQEQIAHDLVAALAANMKVDGKPIRRVDFREHFSNDICHARMWRAVVSFGEPDVSRETLLAEFDFLAKRFPKSQHADRAKETARILWQMIAEDKAHAAKPAKEFDQLTQQEQAEELIFQLREQNGQQWSQPGSCDIFLDPRGEESPASLLVAMGFDAVPALIKAVDDERFTRSVGYHRNFYFSHHVLRVGDCAATILESIAGRNFHSSHNAKVKDGDVSETKRRIEAWWKDVQTKGVKQVLIEAVELADDNSPAQAQRLAAAYPDAALAPITSAARKSTNDWQRCALISIAAELPGEEVTKFLEAELAKGPNLRVRAAAAEQLLQRGQRDALAPMIAAWRKVGSTPASNNEPFFDDDGSGALMQLLANSRDVDAINALGEKIARHDVAMRLDIVEALAEVEADAAAVAAAKAVVVAALADTEERLGMGGTWGGKSFSDPRICDMAAHLLAARYPDEFTFDLEGSLRQRDRQRLEMQNTWRASHNLPQLPLPMMVPVVIVPAEKVNPLLLLASTSTDETRLKSLREIEKLGPGAKPAAQAFAAGLPEDDPQRAEFDRLVARLASTVTQVEVVEKSIAPDDKAKAAIEALRGAVLTGEHFAQLLAALTNDLPDGAGGVSLVAHRDAESGVSLVVEFTPAPKAAAKEPRGWTYHQRVRLGQDGSHSVHGSQTDDTVYISRFDALQRAIDEALRDTSAKDVGIRATFKRDP